MIEMKYKKLYEIFINHYKNHHVNPWHNISEDELYKIYNNLTSTMNIDDNYSFNYFINYIIKRLSGSSDAHTKCVNRKLDLLPITFKCFNGEMYVNYPSELKGTKLLQINNIAVDKIIKELDNIITYGTIGKRKSEIEKFLSDKNKLFSLPSLKAKEIIFKLEMPDKNIVEKTYKKEKHYNIQNNEFVKNATYEIKGNILIYYHSSVQMEFKDKIEKAINELELKDLSKIDKIIIDLRGNTGGNASLNKPLIKFLQKHIDKTIITLTDYRIFSGGRYALIDLIKLGSITIGEEIGTPINCYGNSNWISTEDYAFSVSERFLYPGKVVVTTKEEFKKVPKDLLKPVYFKPDIYVERIYEDFINNKDTIMEVALKTKYKKT